MRSTWNRRRASDCASAIRPVWTSPRSRNTSRRSLRSSNSARYRSTIYGRGSTFGSMRTSKMRELRPRSGAEPPTSRDRELRRCSRLDRSRASGDRTLDRARQAAQQRAEGQRTRPYVAAAGRCAHHKTVGDPGASLDEALVLTEILSEQLLLARARRSAGSRLARPRDAAALALDQEAQLRQQLVQVAKLHRQAFFGRPGFQQMLLHHVGDLQHVADQVRAGGGIRRELDATLRPGESDEELEILGELAADLCIELGRDLRCELVVEEGHLAEEIRLTADLVLDPKAPTPGRLNDESPFGERARLQDLRRRSDGVRQHVRIAGLQPVAYQAHAERLVRLQTLGDELFVAWLEDVQAQRRPGEEDRVERKHP